MSMKDKRLRKQVKRKIRRRYIRLNNALQSRALRRNSNATR